MNGVIFNRLILAFKTVKKKCFFFNKLSLTRLNYGYNGGKERQKWLRIKGLSQYLLGQEAEHRLTGSSKGQRLRF